MTKKKQPHKDTDTLRREAESRMGDKGTEIALPGEADARRMLHELEVHQIELELQNEELKRTRAELEQQLEKYSDLYNFAPIGYFTLDVNGTIRESNLTGAKLLGIERSRLIGSRFALLVSGDSRPAFDVFLTQKFAGTAGETCEIALQGEQHRYVQIEGAAVESAGGAARQCRMAVIDITRRRQAEESLHRYELLSQNSFDIVLLICADNGRILEANTAAVNAYGYTRDELLGMTVPNLRAVGTLGLTVFQMAQADEKGILFETVHRRKDGSTFPVEVSSQGATSGGTRTLISVIRDITQRKQSEETLRKSEQRYHSLFENMLDAFAYCKMLFDNRGLAVDFIHLDVNEAFGRLTGLRGVIGKRFSEVIPGIQEAHPELFEIFGRVALTGKPERFNIEFTPLDAWFSVSVFSTEKEFFVAVFDDITKRKRAETMLNQANRKLIKAKNEVDHIVAERTSELTRAYETLRLETEERHRAEAELRQSHKLEAVGTLAGGIAHDFNNILAAIIGFAEMARDKTPEESLVWRHMDRVVAAGMRGRELVKQILAFSRRAEPEKRPIKLATIVKDTLRLLRASLPTSIVILTNVEAELGFVLADPIQIQQVIMNLCTNAAHSMRQTGGAISVHIDGLNLSSPEAAPGSTLMPGPYSRLSVRDTGEGMSSDMLEHIFDPFFTTKPSGEGTGLGLSVVHGIVASHGGAVTVSSQPGKGSIFVIYFPVIPEEQSRSSEDEGSPVPRGHERILFVDDEEELAAVAGKALGDLGYLVTCKTRAREALALFRLDSSRFDLVITDQTMPEMAGNELIAEIFSIRPNIPVIMCTGFSHIVDSDVARVAGVKAFLMKPLTKREFAVAVRKALDEQGGWQGPEILEAPPTL